MTVTKNELAEVIINNPKTAVAITASINWFNHFLGLTASVAKDLTTIVSLFLVCFLAYKHYKSFMRERQKDKDKDDI